MLIPIEVPDDDLADVAAHLAQEFAQLATPLLPPASDPPAALLAQLNPGDRVALVFAAIVRDASFRRKSAILLDQLQAQATAVPVLGAKALGVDPIVAKVVPTAVADVNAEPAAENAAADAKAG